MSCVVVYMAAGMPDHLARQLDFKGTVLVAGAETTVTDEAAGLLVAAWGVDRPGAGLPKGAGVRLVSGTPAPVRLQSGRVKEQLRREMDRLQTWNIDPARAIDGVPSLSAEGKKILDSKGWDAAVKAGEADQELALVALVAKALGRLELAQACVRRAEASRLKS